jgi:carboxypeptidase Q
VQVRLRVGSMMLEEKASSFNVVGELKGRDKDAPAIVLGCHLDSWDVGQGAQDDGAGCVVVMDAVRLLAELPVPPRRTVRAVLYTNEENGLMGGRTYAEAHADENILAAMESDTGAGQPLGFSVDLRDAEGERDLEASGALGELLGDRLRRWLKPMDATDFPSGYSGADIGPLVANGVAGFGLRHDMSGYWPVHHTAADTFDKIDPQMLAKNVAAVTLFAWYLAEHPDPVSVP